jgi:hypothetical protein
MRNLKHLSGLFGVDPEADRKAEEEPSAGIRIFQPKGGRMNIY